QTQENTHMSATFIPTEAVEVTCTVFVPAETPDPYALTGLRRRTLITAAAIERPATPITIAAGSVPAPPGTLPAQDFPPSSNVLAWPDRLAVSPDGSRLLVPAQPRRRRRDRRHGERGDELHEDRELSVRGRDHP